MIFCPYILAVKLKGIWKWLAWNRYLHCTSEMSYYAIDGDIFFLTFVSGFSKLFAVIIYINIYTQTHAHRNIFIHICACICIQIFSLSLLFNFAMEEDPWLDNSWTLTSFRDYICTTQRMSSPRWRISVVEVGKENISGQKHHRDILVRQNCEYFVALFLRQKLIPDLVLCSEKNLRTPEFWDQKLSVSSDNVKYSFLLTIYNQKVPQR